MFDVRTYSPAGPTVKRFHESDAFVRMMAGPIGSAKTTGAAVAEAFFTAMMQRPGPDGIRRAKVGVLRDTYRNLYATLIPTWFRWVPREAGVFVGSDDRPAAHTLSFEAPFVDGSRGGGPCELIAEFKALGQHSVEMVCRGWELTGAMLDEADGLPQDAIPYLKGRVMRYPDKPYRRSRGVWGVFNKPDIDHWLYEMCVSNPPEDLEFFDQPGGLLPGRPYRTNPDAENLHNLDEGYYTIAAAGQPEWYVRRMLRNEWGASISGEPIFPEFSDARHISPVELEPRPGSDLTIGMDAGGTPAAVIMGRDPYGRRVIYGEVVLYDPADPRGNKLAHGVGPKRFAETIRDTIHPRFRGCRFSIAYCDPAAQYGADREAGEYSWIEIVGQELKLPVLPAPSNEIDLRLEAVRGPLRDTARDGGAMLLLNPSCKMLRKGFAADYKWEEADPKAPGKRLKPQKTKSSHVHDALQYVLLGDTGRAGVTGGAKFDRWSPSAGAATDNVWAQIDAASRGSQPSYGGSQGYGAGPSYDTAFNLWRS